MTREYGNKRSSRSRGGATHQFLVITVTFLLGYLAASFFDIETISHWVNTQVLAHHEMKREPSKPDAQQAAIPPKPKFEFYTLLANEKVPGSQPSTNSTAATQPASAAAALVPTSAIKAMPANGTAAVIPTTATTVKPNAPKVQQPALANKTAEAKSVTSTASSGKGTYLVQVASFKTRQDAEHMKGTLILKGFNVYIIPVSHATKGNWFRVVVGPYPNRVLAQQAQVTLAKNERLNGMVTSGG